MIATLALIRALVSSLFNLITTIVFSILVILASVAKCPRVATVFVRIWALMLMWSFGIRVDVEGEENIPATGGGIIAFNHQSHLDIPSIVVATRKQIRFGAKIELFSVPFFGPAMAAIGTLKIARDNRAEVLKIYDEAAQRFKQNTLFVLAPEGTRQREPRLGKFKKGPFIFAMNARVPLIPVVIKGAYAAMPPHKLLINVGALSRTIKVRFLPPIDSTRFTMETLDAFVAETSTRMNEVFDRL